MTSVSRVIPMNEGSARLGRDVSVGPLVGTVLALTEYIAHMVRGTPLLLPSLLPGMLILYILYWLITGLVTAVILAALRATPLRGALPERTQAALLAAAAVALTGHAVLVTHFLIDLRRPWTILLFGAALFATVPLFLLFRKVIPPSHRARPALFTLLPVLIIAVSLPLQLVPERRGGDPSPRSGTTSAGPNIFLFVFDTLRFDHTGTYGYCRATTPAIDSLARTSVVFDRAYASSSWTLPSTASLLTSRYPSNHGVQERADALSERVETLPEILRHAGYHTGLFSGNPFVEPNFGFGKGFDTIHATTRPMYLRLFYLPLYLQRTYARLGFFSGDSDRWVVRYESFWRPALKKEWIEGDELERELFRWIDGE